MVIKNRFGFFEVVNKPSIQEIEEYYSKKYYQTDRGAYTKKYSGEELKYLRNKLEEKLFVLAQHIGIPEKASLLDIGAGEGWALSFFREKGWSVTGLDYSEFGCNHHNPHCSKDLIVGDIYQSIRNLITQKKKFDVILLDNVLEHVIDPSSLLDDCKKLTHQLGCLIIEVPNDFSVLQNYLYDNKMVEKQFWISLPDHLSYFNLEGLNAICAEKGWESVLTISDYPIDLHLLNENTNYSKDQSKGKSCHQQRVATDNLLHSISAEKTVALYKALADLGMGRQIIGFFKLAN